MRLIVITQRVDPDDPALGATVVKLRALAARVDELVVLALSAEPVELPPNVRVKLFGGPRRALRGARLELALAPELREPDTAVLAHMAPIYAVLAAPLVRPVRRPLLLWFTHWRDSRTLRLAERAATRVLSVGSTSFPFATRKLVVTGHGVEVPARPVPRRSDDGVLRLLALGRTSPAKGLDAVIEAVAALGDLPVEAELRGPSLTAEELAYRGALQARIAARGLGDRVRLEEAVPQRSVRSVYARNDVLVSNMRAGALDKVVFEAAAAGLPVLVASPGFDPLVGGLSRDLRFMQDDPRDLAARVQELHAAGVGERRKLGLELRARVAREHSVEHWADRVVEAAR